VNVQEQTREQLLAEINALKAQMKELPRGVTVKVSKAGAISVYGLGKYPVTLYLSQWDKLLGDIDTVKNFVEANRNNPALAKKD
jgi:hypothetical protein